MIADLLELLCLAVLHFPLLLGMGLSMECGMGAGCDCVVAGSVVCSRAICTNGGPLGTPTQYQVDVSGMADGSCSSANCGDLDGSYSITISGVNCAGNNTGIATTTHGWFIVSGCCTEAPTQSAITLAFNQLPNQIQVTLSTTHANTAGCPRGGGSGNNTYSFSYTSPDVDCSALSSLSIPHLGDFSEGFSAAACTGSGATVTVTTV